MKSAGRSWGLALLAVLVVLNGVVIVLLLRSGEPPSTVGIESPTRSAEVLPEHTDAETPALATDDPVQSAIGPANLASRQLVIVDGDVAWRSTLASCGQGIAIVERSVDGGASWATVDLDLSSVVRLRASGLNDAFAVGAGDDCSTTLTSTSNGGETWTRANASLSSAWYLAPTDRSMVDGPRGEAPVPCPSGAIDLAAADVQRGAVLCRDGSVAVSDDGGQSWTTTVVIAGARAMTQIDGGYAVATFEGACEALSIYSVTSEGQAQTEAFVCAPSSPSEDIAISVSSDQVWVWSGAELAISRDGGQTW